MHRMTRNHSLTITPVHPNLWGVTLDFLEEGVRVRAVGATPQTAIDVVWMAAEQVGSERPVLELVRGEG